MTYLRIPIHFRNEAEECGLQKGGGRLILRKGLATGM